MSGAAIGMITALALAGSAVTDDSTAWRDFRFGARRPPTTQGPLFRPGPSAQASQVETAPPPAHCRTPVAHGDAGIDPKFVVQVPKGPGVPVFTMRWAPSTPCDPARAGQIDGPAAVPMPRR
jgi:hypothetical protein